MSVSAETRYDLSVDQALDKASAEQLRRAIARRAEIRAGGIDDFGEFIEPDGDTAVEDTESLDEARARWRRGDRREALHYLELALGRDFDGLGDLKPEDLR